MQAQSPILTLYGTPGSGASKQIVRPNFSDLFKRFEKARFLTQADSSDDGSNKPKPSGQDTDGDAAQPAFLQQEQEWLASTADSRLEKELRKLRARMDAIQKLSDIQILLRRVVAADCDFDLDQLPGDSDQEGAHAAGADADPAWIPVSLEARKHGLQQSRAVLDRLMADSTDIADAQHKGLTEMEEWLEHLVEASWVSSNHPEDADRSALSGHTGDDRETQETQNEEIVSRFQKKLSDAYDMWSRIHDFIDDVFFGAETENGYASLASILGQLVSTRERLLTTEKERLALSNQLNARSSESAKLLMELKRVKTDMEAQRMRDLKNSERNKNLIHKMQLGNKEKDRKMQETLTERNVLQKERKDLVTLLKWRRVTAATQRKDLTERAQALKEMESKYLDTYTTLEETRSDNERLKTENREIDWRLTIAYENLQKAHADLARVTQENDDNLRLLSVQSSTIASMKREIQLLRPGKESKATMTTVAPNRMIGVQATPTDFLALLPPISSPAAATAQPSGSSRPPKATCQAEVQTDPLPMGLGGSSFESPDGSEDEEGQDDAQGVSSRDALSRKTSLPRLPGTRSSRPGRGSKKAPGPKTSRQQKLRREDADGGDGGRSRDDNSSSGSDNGDDGDDAESSAAGDRRSLEARVRGAVVQIIALIRMRLRGVLTKYNVSPSEIAAVLSLEMDDPLFQNLGIDGLQVRMAEQAEEEKKVLQEQYIASQEELAALKRQLEAALNTIAILEQQQQQQHPIGGRTPALKPLEETSKEGRRGVPRPSSPDLDEYEMGEPEDQLLGEELLSASTQRGRAVSRALPSLALAWAGRLSDAVRRVVQLSVPPWMLSSRESAGAGPSDLPDRAKITASAFNDWFAAACDKLSHAFSAATLSATERETGEMRKTESTASLKSVRFADELSEGGPDAGVEEVDMLNRQIQSKLTRLGIIQAKLGAADSPSSSSAPGGVGAAMARTLIRMAEAESRALARLEAYRTAILASRQEALLRVLRGILGARPGSHSGQQQDSETGLWLRTLVRSPVHARAHAVGSGEDASRLALVKKRVVSAGHGSAVALGLPPRSPSSPSLLLSDSKARLGAGVDASYVLRSSKKPLVLQPLKSP